MSENIPIMEAWVKDAESGKPVPRLRTKCCSSPAVSESLVGYPGGVNRNTWFCATCKAKGFVYEVDSTPREFWPASHEDDRWRLDNPREAKMECCEKAFWSVSTASVEPRQPNTNRWRCRSCGASGWMYEVDSTPREQWPEIPKDFIERATAIEAQCGEVGCGGPPAPREQWPEGARA